MVSIFCGFSCGVYSSEGSAQLLLSAAIEVESWGGTRGLRVSQGKSVAFFLNQFIPVDGRPQGDTKASRGRAVPS